MISHVAIMANVTNLIRWQSHRHVVRQSWPFFQNDFAGRIASRVMDTGPAVRQSAIASITAIWGIVVYGVTALTVLGRVDAVLMIPILRVVRRPMRCCCASSCPALRDRSKRTSEMKSLVVGRVVDGYTNILTVKLFARLAHEDRHVRDVFDQHTSAYRSQMRLMATLFMSLQAMNALMLVGETDAGRHGLAERPRGCRHRRHGDPAHLADRLGGRLGRRAGDRHLREPRHHPGGHDDDRQADRPRRTATARANSRSAAARSASTPSASATGARRG